MKLIKYIPPFLQDVREFKVITGVEDFEIENLTYRINQILKEVIVADAESYGLTRYEKIYNIKNTTNDLTTRRFNILSKINNRVPYTYNWLVKKLNNTIGEGNYVITQDINNYKINIEILALFKDIATMLNKDLREQLPANLRDSC